MRWNAENERKAVTRPPNRALQVTPLARPVNRGVFGISFCVVSRPVLDTRQRRT
jgi:hypothetical protein